MKNSTSQTLSPTAWKVQRFSRWLNGPSRYSTRICSFGPVERDAAGEGLAHQLVGDRHVGDDDLDAFRLLDPPPDLELAAQRHEFGIALDVGDEIEHLGGGVPNAALVGKLRHR